MSHHFFTAPYFVDRAIEEIQQRMIVNENIVVYDDVTGQSLNSNIFRVILGGRKV